MTRRTFLGESVYSVGVVLSWPTEGFLRATNVHLVDFEVFLCVLSTPADYRFIRIIEVNSPETINSLKQPFYLGKDCDHNNEKSPTTKYKWYCLPKA